MKAVKRVIALLLAAVTLLTALASCDRDYDEAEVKAAAASLIKKSDILEDIIFGKGFDKHIDGTSAYQPAVKEDVKRYAEAMGESFKTVDELKAVLSKVYTVGYKNDILSGVLSGDMNFYTRYYQDGDNIMVYTNFDVKKKDEIEYHYETLKVSDVNDQKITVSIEVTVTRTEGKDQKSQRKEIFIDMLEEIDGWKLDTPTYAVYNENEQSYKDLENELNKR